jgi:hypothetical protein
VVFVKKIEFKSSTKILVHSPGGAPGTVDVRVFDAANGSAALRGDEFTFTSSACTDSWTGRTRASDTLTVTPNGILTNLGTLTMDDDSEITGSSATFDNDGTIDSDPGASQTAYIERIQFDNSGVIALDSGTLNDHGPVDLDSGSSFAGSGTLETSGTLSPDVGLSIGSLTLDGGVVAGSKRLIVLDNLNVLAGTIDGVLTNAGSGVVDPSVNLLVYFGTLNNTGTLTLDDGSEISGQGGTFNNSGILDVDPGASGTASTGSSVGSPLSIDVISTGPSS